ncbi:MAG: START domain-containing protein [Pseudomonadota bacterium]
MQADGEKKMGSTGNKSGGGIGKWVVVVLGVVLAIPLLATQVLKYSGDDEWVFLEERDGTKMYSLKKPGESSKQFKMVLDVRAPLSTIVAALQDPDVCEYVGCYASKQFEYVDEWSGYYTFRYDMGFPFKAREMVVLASFTQDPETKALFWEIKATPDKLPADDCCLRLTNMHNTWHFTPQPNGAVRLEYIVHQDMGGWMPDYLYNTGYPAGGFRQMRQLQKIFDLEKYKTQKLAFVEEFAAAD